MSAVARARHARPVRTLRRRTQKILPPTISFLGRIAGIAVTLFLVALVGVDSDTNYLFLAIATTTFAGNTVASLVEVHAVAVLGQQGASGRTLLATAPLLGVFVALVVGVGIGLAVALTDLGSGLLLAVGLLLLTVPLSCAFAVYQAHGALTDRWYPPALASLLRTGVILALLPFATGEHRLVLVPAAFIVGELLRLALCHYRLPLTGTFDRQDARPFASAVLKQLTSSVFSSANPMVDRYLSVGLHFGTAALYDLAEKASNVFTLMLTQGVLPVLHRRWSQEPDTLKRRQAMHTSLRWLLPLSAGFVLVAGGAVWLVAPVLLSGLGSANVHTVQLCSFMFMVGMPGYVWSQVIVRQLVLEKRTFILTPLGVGQLALNVALDLLLGHQFGLAGVAAATACVQWMTAVALALFSGARLSVENSHV